MAKKKEEVQSLKREEEGENQRIWLALKSWAQS